MNSTVGYSSVDAVSPSPVQWNILEQTRIEKAASDGGFDITLTREGSWLVFRSSAFSQRFGVEQQSAHTYRVEFSDLTWGKAVAEDCSLLVVQQEGLWPIVASNVTGYDFLHHVLLRAASLCRVLANETLGQFRAATVDLPASTEAERLVIQRVGQDIFRRGLIEYCARLEPRRWHREIGPTVRPPMAPAYARTRRDAECDQQELHGPQRC
jgi:hypothetical protein